VDEDNNAILGDFGESRSFLHKELGTFTTVGSLLYMAPEVINSEKFVFKQFLVIFLFLLFLDILSQQTFGL
jgi:serine/threonine protein kinase